MIRQNVCFAALLCGWASASLAQPAMSRGQQQLSVNYEECMNRARRALQTVGFSVAGSGNTAQGFKDASGVYIICNEAPKSGVVVNIVVASLSNDANVPGLIRQQLQTQMERPGSAPIPGSTWSWEAVKPSDCSGFDTGFESNGFQPVPSEAKRGEIAICWDGKNYNNNFKNSGKAWCTYKTVDVSACTGGGNAGIMYRAVQK